MTFCIVFVQVFGSTQIQFVSVCSFGININDSTVASTLAVQYLLSIISIIIFLNFCLEKIV